MQMQVGWHQWLVIDRRRHAGIAHALCVHIAPTCEFIAKVQNIRRMQRQQLLMVGSCCCCALTVLLIVYVFM